MRALLSSEVGIRAAEGHIGPVNRWFAGTQHIDEIEALCVELLKQVFRARYADHRLVASMIGNLAVYTALTEPGDVIMSLSQPFGGHSSNRVDGPAGVRGLKIVDIPFDPVELEVDLDLFRKMAPLVRPRLVALGASMTLFPFPLQAMQEVIAEWGGRLFFDGAHQLGLVAGGQFQDPLREGAAVMTGSAGKTFSGPQSGIIVWDDPAFTAPLTHSIFPVLAATHQVNRVAALAASAAEMLAYRAGVYGQHRAQRAGAGRGPRRRGIPVLGAHKGYTTTHQVIADVRRFGGGLAGGAAAGPRQHHHQQEPDPHRPLRGLGPPRRPAPGHHRGHPVGHGRGRDGNHRRLHRAHAGRTSRAGECARRRAGLQGALPDALLLLRERHAFKSKLSHRTVAKIIETDHDQSAQGAIDSIPHTMCSPGQWESTKMNGWTLDQTYYHDYAHSIVTDELGYTNDITNTVTAHCAGFPRTIPKCSV